MRVKPRPRISPLQLLSFVIFLGFAAPSAWGERLGTPVAQLDADEAYDPFADYSEFEESSEEEADMNFFRNGRFFSLGLLLGYRGFTGDYDKIYSRAPGFGFTLSYFFDLRFSLTIGYFASNHTMVLIGPTENIIANIDLQSLLFHGRYYLNTQNVTKGLAAFNPYVLFGASRITRNTRISASPVNATDSTTGFDGGGGLEIPLMNGKAFLGGQAYYQFVQFADEGVEIIQSDLRSTGFAPRGDSWVAMATIGINF